MVADGQVIELMKIRKRLCHELIGHDSSSSRYAGVHQVGAAWRQRHGEEHQSFGLVVVVDSDISDADFARLPLEYEGRRILYERRAPEQRAA